MKILNTLEERFESFCSTLNSIQNLNFISLLVIKHLNKITTDEKNDHSFSWILYELHFDIISFKDLNKKEKITFYFPVFFQ